MGEKILKMKLLGTLSLAALATAKVMPSKGKGKGPMNFGGFTDEPIELPDDMPDFSMGKGPGFMGKGPMIEGEWSMDDMAYMPEMSELTENPLAAVQAQIAAITDIEGVKGVLNAIIDMMIKKMESMDKKPPMGEKPTGGKGKGKGGAKGGKGGKAGGKGGAGKGGAGNKNLLVVRRQRVERKVKRKMERKDN